MTDLRLYAQFDKIDQEARMVYGYASTEALDSHGEIVRRAALADALPEFMRWGNIREMHQPSAVGKAKEAAIDARGLWLGAKIVDDEAWEKVKEGVYGGFSIAGRVTARDPAAPNTITGCTLSEISLVDRPANPEAVFTMFKSAAVDAPPLRSPLPLAGEGWVGVPELLTLLSKLESRLAALEATPAPPKGSLRAIAKSDDLGRAEPHSVHDLIKAALKQPMIC